MGNKLPSHNVPLLLVADIICYINNNISYDIKKLQNFTSKSVAYVRSSLAICKLLNVIDEDENINQFADTLGKTPNDEIKVAVMRKFIQEYEPFITFIQYQLNDTTLDEAARKVYVSYEIEGKDYKFLKDLFISWGMSTGIFTYDSNKIFLEERISSQLLVSTTADFNLDDDMTIRLYISNILGAEFFSSLSSAEVGELVDAFKKCTNDSRGAIECAGRAFEDFLRRVASQAGVNVSTKNGIGQVINALYNNKDAAGNIDNKIHNKQASIGSVLGDIRNMAGHSMEARTLERWDLTYHSAKNYVEFVLAEMRSIYGYTLNSKYIF